MLVLGIVAVAVALYLALTAYGSWPVPSGYSFPRHSMWGGPDALYVGTLEDVDGCIRAVGDDSFAVVWPPGYRLSVEDGQPVIHGSLPQRILSPPEEQIRDRILRLKAGP